LYFCDNKKPLACNSKRLKGTAKKLFSQLRL
jgi:hypothetical protein